MLPILYSTENDLDPEHQDLNVSPLQPGKRVNMYNSIGNNQAALC